MELSDYLRDPMWAGLIAAATLHRLQWLMILFQKHRLVVDRYCNCYLL